jgi:hypothetical protein
MIGLRLKFDKFVGQVWPKKQIIVYVKDERLISM